MSISHIGATKVERIHRVGADELNGYGLMHGGRLLTLADETGFLAARRFCGRDCLTRAVHRARFPRPAHAGQRLLARAWVALTGRTSLWTPVQILSETTGQVLMDAVVVYVAVDRDRRPAPVPQIMAVTPDERQLQQHIHRLREQSRTTDAARAWA